ncbi:MAG: hypothetical protein ABF408_08665 [Bifidobacterium aquikefiri]
MGVIMQFEGSFDFSNIENAARDAYTRGLMQAGEHIRQQSSMLAPKESGDLAGSCDVRLDDDGQVSVNYPGPYARYQEYGIFYRMKPRPSPSNGKPLRHDNGQSFYLTTPMMTETGRCMQIVADVMRESM